MEIAIFVLCIFILSKVSDISNKLNEIYPDKEEEKEEIDT